MTTTPRLSKRQSLSTTTVTILFRTTFTRTIKLNLLLDLFKLVISFVLGSFKWTAEMKSHLPLNLVFQYINFTVNLRIYFSVFLFFFFFFTNTSGCTSTATRLLLHRFPCFLCFLFFFLEFYLLINFCYLCFFLFGIPFISKRNNTFSLGITFFKNIDRVQRKSVLQPPIRV